MEVCLFVPKVVKEELPDEAGGGTNLCREGRKLAALPCDQCRQIFVAKLAFRRRKGE